MSFDNENGSGSGNRLGAPSITNGQYKFQEADKEFPRKIWHKADGRIWFGLCFNQGNGEYKGWPIEEQEWREVFG